MINKSYQIINKWSHKNNKYHKQTLNGHKNKTWIRKIFLTFQILLNKIKMKSHQLIHSKLLMILRVNKVRILHQIEWSILGYYKTERKSNLKLWKQLFVKKKILGWATRKIVSLAQKLIVRDSQHALSG